MSVVIIGGHDRMVCQYKKVCKSFNRLLFFNIILKIKLFYFCVGLSMMCYKNQKTSPKDKKEYK